MLVQQCDGTWIHVPSGMETAVAAECDKHGHNYMTLCEELDDLEKKVAAVNMADVHRSAVSFNPEVHEDQDKPICNEFSQTLGEFVRSQQYMLAHLKKLRKYFLS